MPKYQIIVIASTIGIYLLLSLISYIILSSYFKYKKGLNDVCRQLRRRYKNYDYKLTIPKKTSYDIEITIGNKKIIYKILRNLENKHLLVTKDLHWFIKDNPLKSTNKTYNIYNFLNINSENEDSNLTKVIIIYPSIRQKIYMLDECQARFIYPTEKINGCYILSYDELKEYANKEYGDI